MHASGHHLKNKALVQCLKPDNNQCEILFWSEAQLVWRIMAEQKWRKNFKGKQMGADKFDYQIPLI